MKRLLPDIYWGPSGRHGIIDTGKTIEFWLKDLGKDGQFSVAFSEYLILNNTHATDDKGKVSFDLINCTHYVTIEKSEELNKAFVFLHLEHKKEEEFLSLSDVSSGAYYLETNTKHLLGTIPSNSHIDHIIIKNIEQLKQGRIYRMQYTPLNFKVIFPYKHYKFDADDNIVIDYKMKKDKRFDDLVFGE